MGHDGYLRLMVSDPCTSEKAAPDTLESAGAALAAVGAAGCPWLPC
jgi:hypothetical protein